MKNLSALGCLFFCLPIGLFAQQSITINPVKDNTLYQSATGALSNGAGTKLFVGNTNGGARRRAVLKFDIAAALPANATVTGATLTLNMNRTISGNQTVNMHRLTQDWGEGTSSASGNGGGGGASSTGDATWLHTFFSTTNWSSAGGDFIASPTASQTVGSSGNYSWTSVQLNTEVQLFKDSANLNHGWILIGNESSSATAKRFESREGSSSIAPKLVINYTVPCIGPVVNSFTSSADSVCPGEPFSLMVNGTLNNATTWVLYGGSCGGTFLDSSSNGSFTINAISSTDFFVRGEGGCVILGNCDSRSVFVYDLDNGITSNTSNTLLSAVQSGASYQWINCATGNPLPGETSQDLVPPATGNYAVIVSKDGCTDTSICVLGVKPLGFAGKGYPGIEIWPNPAKEKVLISGAWVDKSAITIVDALGRNYFPDFKKENEQIIIELNGFQPGLYTIQIFDGINSHSQRLIISY